MKPVLAALVVLVGVVAGPRPGHAEKVKTNQATKLYSRAGEHAPVILKIKAGQTMSVLNKDGRWLKVRVSGRTGWVPRSKVDLPEADDELVRNTRRRPFVDGRGTKRGWGGASPEDRVGADATGDDEDADQDAGSRSRSRRSDPDEGDRGRGGKEGRDGRDGKDGRDDKEGRDGKDDEDVTVDEAPAPARPVAHVAKATPIFNEPKKGSEESFTAQPRTVLLVGETKGKWTFVETNDGDAGYVLTSKLEIEEGGGGPRARLIDLRARFGVTLVRQSVVTPGGVGTPPDNYTASSSSVTLAVGGSVLYPYERRYWLGGELAYDFDYAVPGISYMNQTTSFQYHVLNLRAVLGYDLQKPSGMAVFGRLGLHYDSFQVSNVGDFTRNTAKLPNQIITAPSIGAALWIPRLTKDLGLKVSLDVVPFLASVKQTKNLEDGTDPSAKALFLGGSLTYRWKPRMDLQLTYDLSYTSLSFGGPAPATSMRGHTAGMTASGSDFNNALAGGIAYAF
ncbi:MAG TPA: SH3 domain-containing protein [Kofleriaceae bacterium]|nr:SH3 domain-containing protein [Kofleriaceae bacterium]